MYASKRTIGRQGLWSGSPASKNGGKKIDHNNKGNANGRKFFVQTVTKEGASSDANEVMTKTVVHLTSGDTYRIKRKKHKRPGYLKSGKNRRAN